MSAAIDAKVLIYASDSASPLYERARSFLEAIAEGPDLCYVFWPTIMAYLRIATHPAIFRSPLRPAAAIANVESLRSSPFVRSPGETDGFWEGWRAAAEPLRPRGNLIPDTHLVALMRQNGVSTLWTRDHDFKKFQGIHVADPYSD